VARVWPTRSELAPGFEPILDRCRLGFEVKAAGRRACFSVNAGRFADWPRRYLAPAFSFAPAAVVSPPAIAVVEDDRLHRELRAFAAATSPPISSATYEDEPADRYVLPDGIVALLYRDRPGVTLIQREAGAVGFVTTVGDAQAPFEAARLLREVLRRRLEADGHVVLHAGAVALDGGVWIVSGPKYAGKTTLVCALTEFAGADFIANDRVFLLAGTDGLEVLAWPMSVRIAPGTYLGSPGLRRWLRPGRQLEYPEPGWDPVRGIDEKEARRFAASGGGPKVDLVPSELVAALGGRVLPGGRLAGVLLPARDAALASEEGWVAPASPEPVAERLGGELLTPDDDDYPDWLGLGAEASALESGAHDLVEDLVRLHPLREVCFSTGRGAARAVEESGLRPLSPP
jgi:hypothetical protein